LILSQSRSNPNCVSISSVSPENSRAICHIPAGHLLSFNIEDLKRELNLLTFENGQQTDFETILSEIFNNFSIYPLKSNDYLYNVPPRLLSQENPICKSIDDLSILYQPFVMDFLTELEKSIKIRLDCLEHTFQENSQIAVLFSGGVDSLLITKLIDKLWPLDRSIDLLNVSFLNPKSGKFDSWDRLRGLEGFQELKTGSQNPSRLQFVEINVSKQELDENRRYIIDFLLPPNNTIMDESIGTVLWFASRGQGSLLSGKGETSYRCPARAIFLGSGADELLGGYTRCDVSKNTRYYKILCLK